MSRTARTCNLLLIAGCGHSPVVAEEARPVGQHVSLQGRHGGLSALTMTPEHGKSVCHAMDTEKTNGESTPPAMTSFSPARSGA
jgi:hypothetical protein